MTEGSATGDAKGNDAAANGLAILIAGLTLLPTMLFNRVLEANRPLGLLDAMAAAKNSLVAISAVAAALAALLAWLLFR